MATENRIQDAVLVETAEARDEHGTFRIEEIEVACDAPVTVYGRMQP